MFTIDYFGFEDNIKGFDVYLKVHIMKNLVTELHLEGTKILKNLFQVCQIFSLSTVWRFSTS